MISLFIVIRFAVGPKVDESSLLIVRTRDEFSHQTSLSYISMGSKFDTKVCALVICKLAFVLLSTKEPPYKQYEKG